MCFSDVTQHLKMLSVKTLLLMFLCDCALKCVSMQVCGTPYTAHLLLYFLLNLFLKSE